MSTRLESLFNILDSDKKDNYSDEELYDMGKSLDYQERIKYNYKIDCMKKNRSYTELFATYCHESDMIKELIDHDEFYYMLSNIENIIRGSYSINKELFAYLISKYDDINFQMKTIIDDTITKCISMYYPHVKDEDIENIKNTIIQLCNPKHGLLDIQGLNEGGYSRIYKLDDMVIKVGCKRESKEVPYSDNILLPYFKGNIGPDYIEITDYLEDNKDISEDDLYNIYKELREQGIVWLDLSVDNLARVNNKVLENHNTKKYLLNKNGFVSNPNYIKKDLAIGDIVIIDLDHMVFVNEIDKINHIKDNLSEPRRAKLELFEKRYDNEMDVKIKKLG